MTDIATSIKAINPNAEFFVNAEDYNQITWLNQLVTWKCVMYCFNLARTHN